MTEQITPAQRGWLKKLITAGGELRGYPRPNWKMVDRMAEAGLVTIIEREDTTALRFPWSWAGMAITDVGRAVLADKEKSE